MNSKHDYDSPPGAHSNVVAVTQGETGDFLTGRGVSVIGSGVFDRAVRINDLSGFFQDDWKLNRRLTFNLGVRYDFYGFPSETRGRFVNFLQDQLRQGGPPNGLVQAEGGGLAGVPEVAPTLVPSDKNNISPRAGFAADVCGSVHTRAAARRVPFESDDSVAVITARAARWCADQRALCRSGIERHRFVTSFVYDVAKNWQVNGILTLLRETVRGELRAEFFNLLNWINFANPNSNIAVPSTFGPITATSSELRATCNSVCCETKFLNKVSHAAAQRRNEDASAAPLLRCARNLSIEW